MRQTNSPIGNIYTLSDPNTGLVRYVGQAVDVKKRFDLHLHYAKKGCKRTHKEKWIAGLLADGQLPIVETIWTGPYEETNDHEQRIIALYKAVGARLTNGTFGGSTTRGRVCTEETREKFRKMFTGKCLRPPISEGEKKLLSERTKGKPLRKDVVERMAEQRQWGSEYWVNHPNAYRHMLAFSERGKKLSKKIVGIKDGIETIYASTVEAAKMTGVERRTIVRVANGIYKQCKGYKFKFFQNETAERV